MAIAARPKRSTISRSKQRASAQGGQLVVTGRSPREIAWARFKRNRIGVYASVVSIAVLVLSLGAPIFARLFGVNPNTLNLTHLDVSGIPTQAHGGISWSHPLGLLPGTGRDPQL